MDRQAIYNRVKDHLLAQGARSTNDYGACRYRGDNGLKCAIGCLIEDQHYTPDLEGGGAHALPIIQALYQSGVDASAPGDDWFLSDLQAVHDRHPALQWAERLAGFANSYGLEP